MTGSPKFSVGVYDATVAGNSSPTASSAMDYLTTVSANVDSFWVSGSLDSMLPRALWSERHRSATELTNRPDSYLTSRTILSHLADRSRSTRMQLGLGITDADHLDPAVTAQAGAAVHLLTRGRAVLGIAPSEVEGDQFRGADWTRPVRPFEEAMATIRALWDARGELVNRESEFFPLQNAVFDLPACRTTRPKIWIGAHGLRMLRAVGKYADAFFPAFPHRPRDYAQRLDVVLGAASDAGRDPAAIVPAVMLMLVTGRDREDVDASLDSDVTKAVALSAFDGDVRRPGAHGPLDHGSSGGRDLLPQLWDNHTAINCVREVPSGVVREIVLNGTPNQVVDQVAEWRDCGAQHVVVVDISRMGRTAQIDSAELGPLIQILRRSRTLADRTAI